MIGVPAGQTRALVLAAVLIAAASPAEARDTSELAQASQDRPARQSMASRPRALQPEPVVLVRSEGEVFAAVLAGRFAGATANPDLAAQAWTQAARARPGDSKLMAAAVQACLDAGTPGPVLTLVARRPLSALPNQAALVLAVDALANGRLRGVAPALAGRRFETVQGLVARQVQAWALAGLGDFEAAFMTAEQPSGNRALDRAALLGQAMLLDHAGRAEEADTVFESAWRSGARLVPGVIAHAATLARAGQAERARAVLDRARATLGGQEPALDDALARLSGPPPHKPELREAAASALAALAAAIASEDRTGTAGVAEFALALHVQPGHSSALIGLAQSWQKRNMPDRAEAVLAQVTPASPYFVAARSDLAWLIQAKRPGEALALAADTLARVPGRASAVLHAEMLAADARPGEAERAWTRLLETPTGESSAQAGDGDAHRWALHYGRAVARERLGDWSGAETDLRAALRLQPRNSDVLSLLGYGLARSPSGAAEAVTLLRQASRLNQQSGDIAISLGRALLAAGRFEEAVSTLERARELSPAAPEAADWLGDAYWRTARPESARQEWARAIALGLSGADRPVAEAKLRDGLGSVGGG